VTSVSERTNGKTAAATAAVVLIFKALRREILSLMPHPLHEHITRNPFAFVDGWPRSRNTGSPQFQPTTDRKDDNMVSVGSDIWHEKLIKWHLSYAECH
jgi:hypothetical protein